MTLRLAFLGTPDFAVPTLVADGTEDQLDTESNSRAIARLIPGAKPQLIESSCCGMAGSFGYEAEHHQVSLQMAEANLLPSVRAAPDAIIVADGSSCRHQIFDGTRRVAVHVARLLERMRATAGSDVR